MNPPENFDPPTCAEHDTLMVWGTTDFTYREDDIEVVVRHIPAWVCPHGDDAAFLPGVTDELIQTVRELVRVAKAARTQQSQPANQEYVVRVAA